MLTHPCACVLMLLVSSDHGDEAEASPILVPGNPVRADFDAVLNALERKKAKTGEPFKMGDVRRKLEKHKKLESGALDFHKEEIKKLVLKWYDDQAGDDEAGSSDDEEVPAKKKKAECASARTHITPAHTSPSSPPSPPLSPAAAFSRGRSRPSASAGVPGS